MRSFFCITLLFFNFLFVTGRPTPPTRPVSISISPLDATAKARYPVPMTVQVLHPNGSTDTSASGSFSLLARQANTAPTFGYEQAFDQGASFSAVRFGSCSTCGSTTMNTIYSDTARSSPAAVELTGGMYASGSPDFPLNVFARFELFTEGQYDRVSFYAKQETITTGRGLTVSFADENGGIYTQVLQFAFFEGRPGFYDLVKSPQRTALTFYNQWVKLDFVLARNSTATSVTAFYVNDVLITQTIIILDSRPLDSLLFYNYMAGTSYLDEVLVGYSEQSVFPVSLSFSGDPAFIIASGVWSGSVTFLNSMVGQSFVLQVELGTTEKRGYAASALTINAGCNNGEGAANYSSPCQACVPGRFSASGSGPCIPCPAGQFSAASNAQFCDACPAGFITNSTGQTLCSPCGTGRYQPSIGQSVCELCGVNQYAPLNSTRCLNCTGFVVNNGGECSLTPPTTAAPTTATPTASPTTTSATTTQSTGTQSTTTAPSNTGPSNTASSTTTSASAPTGDTNAEADSTSGLVVYVGLMIVSISLSLLFV